MPALAALPDLALAAAGVLLILLAYALFLLRDLITAGFSRVPLIGGWAASHLGSALDSAGHAVMHGADSAFGGAEAVFRVVETWTLNVLNVIAWAGRSVGDALANIAEVQIPRTARYVLRQAHDAANGAGAAAHRFYLIALHTAAADLAAARSEAVSLWHRAERDAAAAANVVMGYAHSAYLISLHTAARDLAVAEHDISSAYDSAVARADTAAAAARAEAVTLFHRAEADLHHGLAASEAAASAAVAAAARGIYTDLETWGDKAVHIAWPDAEGGLEALRRALGSAWPDIAKSLPYLEGLGAAGLLGALIRSMAGVNVLAKVMTDCVVPNCDNLGKIGRELSQLQSAGAVAAVLAWLAYTAADPVAAANDTVTVAGPLTDAVFGPLVALISAGAEHL